MSSSRPGRLAVHAFAFAAALVVAVLSAGMDSWPAPGLALLVALLVATELMATRLDADTHASGGLLVCVLTAVLYGPGPAAALGVIAVCVSWWHLRGAGWVLRGNIIATIWPSLVAGIVFHALAGHAQPSDSVGYLAAFVTFLVALAINLAGVVCFAIRWAGPRAAVRFAFAMLRPILSAELVSAVLTVAALWVVLRLHLAGLAMFGIVLVIFQHLVGELLTSRRRAQKLRVVATTDELTGLANRERFRDTISERIVVATAAGTSFPVLLMDLDHFKEVNDTLGHAYGDHLLRELGPRLQEAIGPGGFVARLGGDEFGFVPGSDGSGEAEVEAIVTALIAAVARPFQVDELALEVGASVGVARFPEDGEDSHALMRCADVAMYAAKEAQTDYKRYLPAQSEHSAQRLNVLSDIRRALTDGEIVVHYQPIVDVADGSVTGAEALVRWEHPEHGLIPPGAFVTTVEQSGLIGPLTRHVLDSAIGRCADWRRGGRDLSVAVNLSVRNLLDRDLPLEIERMLAAHGVPASALQLEITESMIMSDPDRALATVGRLSRLGARLSVDDFGTGYSSLANLRRLPIDELKIDRSFVSPMLRDESDLIIVRSTINLAHDLGLRIIAEGVEDRETLDRLAALGCDLAQGFHLSRPLGAAAFDRWLQRAPSPAAVDPRSQLSAGWPAAVDKLAVAAPPG